MPITDSKPTSDNPQTKAPQNVQYAAPYPQQFEDDTIDLFELWITLWNKQWLVIALTVIAELGSVVYVLLHSPVHFYRTDVSLKLPAVEDLKSLKVEILNYWDKKLITQPREVFFLLLKKFKIKNFEEKVYPESRADETTGSRTNSRKKG